MANENSSRSRTRSVAAQIGSQRRADVRGQWQRGRLSALPPNADLPGTPVDIIQVQTNNFTGPYAEPREQKQNGIVPTADGSLLVAALQNAFHVGGRKKPG